MGTEIYYHFSELLKSALYARKHGANYLRYLPPSSIQGMLQDFIAKNFWYLADEAWLRRFDGTFADNVSHNTKVKLAEAIAVSAIFLPENALTLYPLVPIKVACSFVSNAFFIVSAGNFDEELLPENFNGRQLPLHQFPPLSEWKGRIHRPSAWLGVRSPAELASNKMKAAILGALALTPLPRHRHLFSGRANFGGACLLSDSATTSFGDAHMPPLMYDLIMTDQDRPWLLKLSELFSTAEKSSRRKTRALEYFYRAWNTEASERFPLLCMALDAVFGDANRATQAVIDGVRATLGDHISDARLRKLMFLRAAVIHGGAPDVYDSSKYTDYYDRYHTDPIFDMELIVTNCLRLAIFSGTIREQPDPNEAIIAEQQSKGLLPRNIRYPTIMDPEKITSPDESD